MQVRMLSRFRIGPPPGSTGQAGHPARGKRARVPSETRPPSSWYIVVVLKLELHVAGEILDVDLVFSGVQHVESYLQVTAMLAYRYYSSPLGK